MNCQICGTELPPGAMFCGECGSAVNATVQSRRRAEPGDTSIVRPIRPRTSGIISVPYDTSPPPLNVPDALPAVAPATTPTPLTARKASALFVFTVNTGQVVSITGGGLLGRRPLAQPGENFDQLVQVADLTMSVSKSHFEFGQTVVETGGGTEEVQLWVNDRFSGNGTVLSRPGESALRLEPGRRVIVPRGSRLDIGELFITVG